MWAQGNSFGVSNSMVYGSPEGKPYTIPPLLFPRQDIRNRSLP
jgi:hypothetical protein